MKVLTGNLAKNIVASCGKNSFALEMAALQKGSGRV